MTTPWAYDFTSIIKEINAIKGTSKCGNCHLDFDIKWCYHDKAMCYFCRNFLPLTMTPYAILQSIDWYFIKSGETSRVIFYNEFLDNFDRWCYKWHIIHNESCIKLEEELRNVKDWSREYWY